MAHFNTATADNNFIYDWLNIGRTNPNIAINLGNLPILTNPIANANHQLRVGYSYWNDDKSGGGTLYDLSYYIKVHEGNYACFVELPCNEYKNHVPTGNTYNQYILIAKQNVTPLFDAFNVAIQSEQSSRASDVTIFSNDYVSTSTTRFKTIANNYSASANDILDRLNLYMHPSVNISNLISMIRDNGYTGVLASDNTFSYGSFGYSENDSWYNQTHAVQYLKIGLPIFKYDNIEGITKYLTDGDESGSIDPFDPNNPQKIKVEDIRTNYKIFVSPDDEDKNRTHFSVVAYNDDYIHLGDNVVGLYGMNVVVDEIESVLHPVTIDMGYAKQSKYPTMGLLVNVPNVYNIKPRFEALDGSMIDTRITVGFNKAPNKESNCKVVDVYEGSQIMSRSNIPDGYRFSHTTDGFARTVDVLFRHITIEDLKDYYPDHEDVENDSTGTDTTFAGASGLHTYAITDNDFKVINSKLWTTDWTQVFKSTTIDPVKCVIACKSIPFTANVVNSADVFIANMNTGLHKNYVKTVKSFNVGTGVYIPAFNGDFTDITMTRIHCYLPYIGWVELPASECVSRIAYRNVPANIKRVSFKYLVDFVDGTCRCIISVNGTERWFFDGNCSIDVPVTSDNHTQAISNALRSGLQTGLSIVSGVVGAVSGNAGAVAGGIVGTMTSAPNIFPTYNYTATSNGSGYINASMNTNIILVVERPNVVRPSDYSQRVGRPCGLSLQLGSLRGFTKCNNVDVSGITATDNELTMIKSLLETGVYL